MRTRNKANELPLGQQLAVLAMAFRGTRDETERARIADKYARVVLQLIESGKWGEIPPLEDQLPDERMPGAFFEYWSLPLPNSKASPKVN
jgi:hypothetical protein